jgi:heptaprenyl diphosphate synthase
MLTEGHIKLKSVRKLPLLALMISQGLILSIVESWIPVPVAIPGVKLGLANIVTLLTIIFFGTREALMVVSIRVLLSSLFGGGLMVFAFSIVGGLLSTLTMAILYKKMYNVFSILGISIAGAIMHNIGQLSMASMLMKDFSVMSYLPILLFSGIIMGFVVGVCTKMLVPALEKTGIFS